MFVRQALHALTHVSYVAIVGPGLDVQDVPPPYFLATVSLSDGIKLLSVFLLCLLSGSVLCTSACAGCDCVCRRYTLATHGARAGLWHLDCHSILTQLAAVQSTGYLDKYQW